MVQGTQPVRKCHRARARLQSVLPGQYLRDGIRLEAELEQRGAGIEMFAVRGDLSATELEEAHALEADGAPGAARNRVAHDVAEGPFGRGARRRLDDRFHRPAIILAFVEHAVEHAAELLAARMRPEEGVDVA